jgi:2-C-methyl-D-erythritol 4-phosphate cytidylyltransferase
LSVSVIIPAAGKGERFGKKKQFLHYKNKSVLTYAISPFVLCDEINEIIIAVSKDDMKQVNGYTKFANFKKKIIIVEGGLYRQDSVRNAIKSSNKKNQIICIHDCVRPFISKSLIQKAIKKCISSDAVVVAVPSTDTLKETKDFKITKTIDRDKIWKAQTPQLFKRSIIEDVLFDLKYEKVFYTDESSLVEQAGYDVSIVEGSPLNIKITTKDDWLLAKAIFKEIYID